MEKTTVYLTSELKARIASTARARGSSEAAVIRDAIERFTERPRPTLPLFDGSGETNIAERVDEILAEGFGRD
jgi:ribbon-helix-helix CopG family protein